MINLAVIELKDIIKYLIKSGGAKIFCAAALNERSFY